MNRALTIGLWLALACACACGERPPALEVGLDNLKWSLSCDSAEFRDVPARVPGHVLPVLVEAGLVPDPNFGTQERDVQWVELEAWTFSTHVPLPLGWKEGEQARLEFEGLDTYAHVLIDGVEVLASNNAFRRWSTPPFQIPPAGFRLDIRLDPVAQAGERILGRHGLAVPAGNELKPIGKQTSPFTRKAGFQFGWDWGPRLAGPGIPGSLTLIRESDGVATRHQPKQPTCSVVKAQPQEAEVMIQNREGWSLALTLRGEPVEWRWNGASIRIPQPELWWPVHMGNHPLYTFHWTHEETGQTLEHTLGIRTVEWEQFEDQWGTSFCARVNGERFYARGANVIPPDYHDVNRCEGWSDLVEESLAANMNMVRVWGGGVYPPSCFFDACDESGLLVWQDFMFACSMVPDDEAFVSNVNQEAREHVFRLRHHPSLALWCGNNEVLRAWHQWGWQEMYDLHGTDSVRLAQAYDLVFHEVLPAAVEELSDVHYHPTSPTLDPLSGDEHAWEIWFGLEDFDYYSRNSGRFVSEFGLQSLPNRHTLAEAGISAFEDEALQFRQRSKMEWLEPGFDGWDMMLHFMTKTTGAPAPSNLDDWIFRSQATQAEGLRQALERHRTSRGRYAGSLYWSLNDIWPAVSWSTVDFGGRWKLGHYAAQRANAPRTVLWDRGRTDSLTMVLFNDVSEPLTGTLRLDLCSFDGTVLRTASSEWNVPGRSETAWVVGAWADWSSSPRQSYLRWRFEDMDGDDWPTSSALWVPAVEADLSPARVDVKRQGNAWQITSSHYCPVVALTANVPGHFSDNGMSLEAGKTLSVRFEAEQPQHASVEIAVASLNPTPQ